tara:strand:+ start:161 stop:586 length:426 start_codon:yes stop_codon:yes gene_type:complete
MSKKNYIIFHASSVDSSSVTSADDGTNIDLCALPASSITSIFAEEDFVYIYFKESGRFEFYDGNILNTGVTHTALEQTFVRLSVSEDKEIDVVKSLVDLLLQNPRFKKHIIFDGVNNVWPIENVTAVQIRRHLTPHVLPNL